MILSSIKENISDHMDTFALLVERTGVNVAGKVCTVNHSNGK